MMFDLPDAEQLYSALIARDPAWDGRAYVGVRTTGVFCRLTCPARKPKPENCQFYADVSACLDAGFRPCKRCHPINTAAQADPAIQDLVTRLEANPGKRWSETDVAALGYDPSTIRRAFKRNFGCTFLDMARQRRLQSGFSTLASGGQVIHAQLDAGYESPSAFRAAFAKLLGHAPANFSGAAILQADWFQTPLGPMIAVSDQNHLHLLEFSDRKALPNQLNRLSQAAKGRIGFGCPAPTSLAKSQLDAFFQGKSADFTIPLALHGTAFTKLVWEQLQTIPAGQTRSYSQLADTIGRRSAVRAVAQANGANQIAIIIPCHRVIGADGSLTGYGGGIWRKQKLIELEAHYSKKESR
jgi:AraC family transcriptional regulator, regulatory protein of adaptative response / methylated-DNA-[protein]-cysteine methyltransferase